MVFKKMTLTISIPMNTKSTNFKRCLFVSNCLHSNNTLNDDFFPENQKLQVILKVCIY